MIVKQIESTKFTDNVFVKVSTAMSNGSTEETDVNMCLHQYNQVKVMAFFRFSLLNDCSFVL